jgi:membrane protease subunit (stomatin/prohibitin family)
MALFDGIKRQLRSVIEWTDPTPDSLFSQWTDNGDEIKNASKLIVNPGQGCIFVYQGQVRSVITKACMVDLQTDNIPFWTTISKFMQFFESEHKVGLYFFKTSKILDQKWGTSAAIKYEDPKYKFPVGLRAFGNYSYRIAEPKDFFINVIGSQAHFLADDFRQIMSGRIIQPIADFLAESRFTYTDIDANRNEIATGLNAELAKTFAKLGFEITDFRIEGTNFDEDTLRRINRIADLTAEAQAAKAVGLDYANIQQLEAMREAARNEGGVAGMGVGLGAGMSLGQTMAQGFHHIQSPSTPSPTGDDPLVKLEKLKKMVDAKLITEKEYTQKKQQILDNF